MSYDSAFTMCPPYLPSISSWSVDLLMKSKVDVAMLCKQIVSFGVDVEMGMMCNADLLLRSESVVSGLVH